MTEANGLAKPVFGSLRVMMVAHALRGDRL